MHSLSKCHHIFAVLDDNLLTRLLDQSCKKRSKTTVMLAQIAKFVKGIFVAIPGMGPKSFLLLIHERL